MLAISGDTNGYDEYFGVAKTDFGRGTLITRHIDYQNYVNDPVVYTDYLTAKTAGAETRIELFEEGDYEVALDYELKNTWRRVFGKSIFDTYTNYRIFLRFSVRNGNSMVYPIDIATKSELLNNSVAKEGFYLDLVRSRYLDINIKKEIMAAGSDGFTEDTRFNRPAKDGDRYTEEGIYTIKAQNRYTGEETVKKIYVGNAAAQDSDAVVVTESLNPPAAPSSKALAETEPVAALAEDSGENPKPGLKTWQIVLIVIVIIFCLRRFFR
jgi:hypothetical protein